jgi:hypothetical protein
MPTDVNEAMMSDVVNSDFKVAANSSTKMMDHAVGMTIQNSTNHQQAMQQVLSAFMAEATLGRAGFDVGEAAALKKVTEADLSRSMAELGAVMSNLQGQMGTLVALIQQLMKGAQTTPPPTA